MGLKHSVYDSDTHFKLDTISRMLRNEGSTKNKLVQHDHNSERFTFEVPRYIEGHDMSQCDVVQIHYVNTDTQTKAESKDFYTVDDLQISPIAENEDVVIFSWLIKSTATVYVGSLDFLIKFKCLKEDDTAYYIWNSAIYKGISVYPGFENSKAIYEEYSDVIAGLSAKVSEIALQAHDARDLAEVNKDRLDILKPSVEDHGYRLDDLEPDLSELKERLTAAETAISKNAEDIKTLQYFADSAQERIDTLRSQVSGLNTRVGVLETETAEIESMIDESGVLA